MEGSRSDISIMPEAGEDACTNSDDIDHGMMERELADLLPPAEEVGKHGFRFSEFRKFLGPAWLVSIAYLDPGNLETDLQVSTRQNHSLVFSGSCTVCSSQTAREILCVADASHLLVFVYLHRNVWTGHK
jgi:hypothetical protein